jgi:hypothetical protein
MVVWGVLYEDVNWQVTGSKWLKLPTGKMQSVIPVIRRVQENSSTALKMEAARFSRKTGNKLPVNTGA